MHDLASSAQIRTVMQDTGVGHVTPDLWEWANRRLLRKAISEFAHERLLVPVKLEDDTGTSWSVFALTSADGRAVYRFRARRLRLDHWHIDPQSLARSLSGAPAALDVLAFVIEFKAELGIRDAMMPVYMDELSSILSAAAFKAATKPHTSANLAQADFQAIESGMTEGHPSFVANSGRLGFDIEDYRKYAPEAAGPLSILWIAVSRAHAAFTAVRGLDYERLISEELGETTIAAYRARLAALGYDPDRYYFMPVHPWQWSNRISVGYVAQIASGDIVALGLSPDSYRPQQSIRTFFNLSVPEKRYVKMSLSILNMGFVLARGLSREDMETTPVFNDWLADLIDGDPVLRETGFRLIREVATMSFISPHYDAAVAGDMPHKQTLAALWRESPVSMVGPGERLSTMAALLHIDPQGVPLVAVWIKSSLLGAPAWIRRYLRAYLRPILHCYYAYDMIFMPHGENVIVVLKNDVPVRIIMKDLAEEMRILKSGGDLPSAVRRNCVDMDDHVRLDGIITDVFDCFFRHLVDLLEASGTLSEARFWELVSECIAEYQADKPEYADKYARYDLWAAEFPRNCINRLQLRDNQQLIDPNDPDKGFEYAGALPTPLVRPRRVRGHGIIGRAMRGLKALAGQT